MRARLGTYRLWVLQAGQFHMVAPDRMYRSRQFRQSRTAPLHQDLVSDTKEKRPRLDKRQCTGVAGAWSGLARLYNGLRDLGGGPMLSADVSLLRMFIGESDRYEKQLLYEWIIIQAKAKGLAGATVFRRMMGFGANTRIIHTSKLNGCR